MGLEYQNIDDLETSQVIELKLRKLRVKKRIAEKKRLKKLK